MARSASWILADCVECDTYLTPVSYLDPIYTARKRTLGQGNIFTSVCHSFCPQGGCFPAWDVAEWCLASGSIGVYTPGQTPPLCRHPPGQIPPFGQTPPLHRADTPRLTSPQMATVSRAVRILLECILVILEVNKISRAKFTINFRQVKGVYIRAKE